MSSYVKNIRKALGNKGAVLTVGRKVAKAAKEGSSLIDKVARSGLLSPEVSNQILTINNQLTSVAGAAGSSAFIRNAIGGSGDLDQALEKWGSVVSGLRKGNHGANALNVGRLLMSTLKDSVPDAIEAFTAKSSSSYLDIRTVDAAERAEQRYSAVQTTDQAARYADLMARSLTSGTMSYVNAAGASHALDVALDYWGRLSVATPIANDSELLRSNKSVWHVPGNADGMSMLYNVSGVAGLSGAIVTQVAAGGATTFVFDDAAGFTTSQTEPSDGAVAAVDSVELHIDGEDKFGRSFPPDAALYYSVAKCSLWFNMACGSNCQVGLGGGVEEYFTLILYGGENGLAKKLGEWKIRYMDSVGAARSAVSGTLGFELPVGATGLYDFDLIVKTGYALNGTAVLSASIEMNEILAVPITTSMSFTDVGYFDDTGTFEFITGSVRWSDLFGKVNTDAGMVSAIDPNKNVQSLWNKWVDDSAARQLELVFEYIRTFAPDVDDACKTELGVANGIMDLAAISRWMDLNGPMAGVTDWQKVIDAGISLITTLMELMEQSSTVAEGLAKYIVTYRTI
jgi:hypothetical protein